MSAAIKTSGNLKEPPRLRPMFMETNLQQNVESFSEKILSASWVPNGLPWAHVGSHGQEYGCPWEPDPTL